MRLLESKNFIKSVGQDVLLKVRVQPRSQKRGIRVESAGILRISVPEPAIKNAANCTVISVLSEIFDVCKSKILLKHGKNCREKWFLIQDMAVSDVLRILEISVKNM